MTFSSSFSRSKTGPGGSGRHCLQRYVALPALLLALSPTVGGPAATAADTPAAPNGAPAAPPGPASPPPIPPLPPAPAPVVPPFKPQLPAGAESAVPLNRPITVDEAIATALAHQPSVGLAIQSAIIAHGRTREARSGLLPSIGIGSNFSENGSSTSGRRTSAAQLPTNLTQTTGGAGGTVSGTVAGGVTAGSTAGATTGGATAGTVAGATGSVTAGTGGFTGTTGGATAGTIAGTVAGATGGVNATSGLTAGTSGGTVAGSTAGSQQVGFSSNNTSHSFNTSLSVRQLLFDFGRTRDSIRAALASERAAGYGVNRAREDLIFSVKQAYYNLLNSQRLVVVSDETVRNDQAHVDEAKARLAAKLAPESDVVKANTALADAQLTLTTAQNNVELDRINLNEQMGIDVRTPVQVAEPPPAAPAGRDLNPLITEAFSRRPEVLQAQQQLLAAQANLSSARTGNLPTLSASASGGVNGTSLFGQTHSWSVGLNLSWDPFDFGLTSGRILESRASLRAQELSLYQAQQTVSSEVAQAFVTLGTSEQQLATATAEVANAQVNAQLATGRYQAGVAIFLEVTDAEAALAQAQANEVNARTSIDIARAALDRAVGRAQ